MPVWIKIGNTNLVFPDEQTMLKVLKEAEISLNEITIIDKK
ncbi:hypothetical protein [Acidianus manzaensis]|nr:hypothetical protein [Acidianus manzaensis]